MEGMYGNVDAVEKQQEEPRGFEQSGKLACRESFAVEENEYEACDPPILLGRKQTEQGAAPAPVWGPWWLLLGGALLGLSLLLNLLLLTLGVTRYTAMKGTVEQAQMQDQQLLETASSPFMIYNKNHQLCVEVEAGESLTAATCHPPSPTKLFRWVLGGRLLHVGSGRCVGVAQSASQRAVRLEPCDAQRPQQHWVCGEGGLLGLAGVTPPLYFNYGNSIRSVVMLYTGNKEWSRWVVYDSHRDLCSRACDVCTPCRLGWAFFQDRCYFYSTSLSAWDMANTSCAAQGAQLLTMDSPAEQKYIRETLKAPSAWVGITNQVLKGAWSWANGTLLTPGISYWQAREPSSRAGEHCALVLPNGHWNDRPCAELHHWVCEGPV
ncbi:macrophage mannose receptor 1-like isoform X1 [Alligator sinensis]|uniref:Macrophage mannose receptor 1-like isoform X1 n=1 Tax=Alligator sinensis TaxID=38654 RepID=A0A3Q0FK66_ALLSI|nr:macrophage mannose receptor 1-like isoform X1 [Alligator sinensis]